MIQLFIWSYCYA